MKRLFGADGIRGVSDTYPLRFPDVELLGRALGAWFREQNLHPTVVVGTDTRESSQRLKIALSYGLTHAGAQVIDVGILPTAAISFLIARKGFLDGGVVVSASHNPVIENGIKVFDHRGVKLSDQDETSIEEWFLGERLLPFEARPALFRHEESYAQEYAQSLTSEFSGESYRGRIVLDCANGASSILGPLAFDILKIPFNVLNASPDGTNINIYSGSEYVRLDPARFARIICQSNAELGIALDGDADRVVLVDREGYFYDGDMLLAFFALQLQKTFSLNQNRIVATPLSNSGFADYMSKNGIVVEVVRNGDKYVTDALLAKKLSLGGEQIGHLIMHTDQFRVTGDGLRTAFWLLHLLAQYPGVTLREMIPGMQKWPFVNVSVSLASRTESQADSIAGLSELIDITQIKIPDLSKFECRPASTESSYRIILESRFTAIETLAWYATKLAKHIQQQLQSEGREIHILDSTHGGEVLPDQIPLSP